MGPPAGSDRTGRGADRPDLQFEGPLARGIGRASAGRRAKGEETVWRLVAEQGLMAFVLAFAAAIAVRLRRATTPAPAPPLTWFIFNEPSGSPQAAADKCEKESNGAYKIEFEFLPADADGQREQLVRRLGAEDSSDRPDRHGRDLDRRVRQRRLDRAVPRRTWPTRSPRTSSRAWSRRRSSRASSTRRRCGRTPQLLWYRNDRVTKAPEDLGRDDRRGRQARPGQGPDPGPGRQVRGPGRLVQRDGRVRRRPHPRRARRRSTSPRRRPRRRSRSWASSRPPTPPTRRSRPPRRTRRGSRSRPAAPPS